MSGYVYLSSPYTHPDPAVRESRFKAACKAAAKLMVEGHAVFAPISHSHPIDLEFDVPKSGAFWKAQDIPLLRHASRMVVLQIPGWAESRGIAWELEMARSLNIPIEFMEAVYE